MVAGNETADGVSASATDGGSASMLGNGNGNDNNASDPSSMNGSINPDIPISPTDRRSNVYGRGIITGHLGNLIGDDGYLEDNNKSNDSDDSDSDDDGENERYPEYTSDHITMRVSSVNRNNNRIHKKKSSECLRIRSKNGLRTSSISKGIMTATTKNKSIPKASTSKNVSSKSQANAHSMQKILQSLMEYIPANLPGVSILNKLITTATGAPAATSTTISNVDDESETEVETSFVLPEPVTPPPTLFYGSNINNVNPIFTQYNVPIPQITLSPENPVNPPADTPSYPRKTSNLIKALQQQQQLAQSYPIWLEVSRQLDSLQGNDQWKTEDESDFYDSDLVRFRLDQLRYARETGDVETLLSLVRTTLQRNLGNMGDPRLYQYSYTGTKQLIEDYISECELSLQTLMASPKIDDTRLLGTLIQTRKAFGRTALVLSGGSTFGVLHVGVLFELLNAKLLPRVISGSSAGSIFASILCIHLDEELDSLLKLLEGDFDIFEKTGSEESTLVRITRFLKYGTWFDNKYLSSTMRSLLGDLTFQEAYYRTRRVLNVSVSPSTVHEMPKLLNYLTAPNVLIWSAVCASCSVPLVFASFDILAKHPKTGEHYSWSPATFIDGSVDNDLPLARLSEMFNVNHFIACQVNPHVAPFLKLSEAISGTGNHVFNDSTIVRSIFSRWSDIWTFTQDIISDEISHFLLILAELGIFKNTSTKFRSVLAQQYSGDITILPQIKWSELGQLFKNPSPEFFEKTRERAAAATWQKMSIIRNHCAIELALDRAILDIRSRLIPHPFAFSEQLATAGRPPRMYHYRRKSEIVLHKALMRKNSWQDVGSKKYWSPSPPFLSAHSSHVSLYSLNPTTAVARYKDTSSSLQP